MYIFVVFRISQFSLVSVLSTESGNPKKDKQYSISDWVQEENENSPPGNVSSSSTAINLTKRGQQP